MADAPVILESLAPRSPGEIALAAHAVQANLVSLRVAWCRRTGQTGANHDIQTPPPGPVVKHRQILIEPALLKGYTLDEIALRLRQVWGEFCALCWVFPGVDPQNPISFDPLPPDQQARCPGHIVEKLQEVQAGLWRLRHEQRARFDRDAARDPAFVREHETALARDIRVFGHSVSHCNDADLFACTCEYAGMLAALRWAIDSRWQWEAPGIMELPANTPVNPPPA